MGWAILAVAIFVILFIMLLLPKAIKGWRVSWGSGFSRIYYVLAFIITFFVAFDKSYDGELIEVNGPIFFATWAFFYLIAFIGFKIFRWIFGGFKKEEKKKK